MSDKPDTNILRDIFPMPPPPKDADYAYLDKLFGDELRTAEAVARTMERVQKLMQPALNPETLANGRTNEIDLRGRAFDLVYEVHGSAPPDHRVSVIDQNTYDGAPDTEGVGRFIGWGKNKVDALRDLCEQFDDHDERPRRKFRSVGLGNPEQPPELVPDDDVTFDDGLTDDDAR